MPIRAMKRLNDVVPGDSCVRAQLLARTRGTLLCEGIILQVGKHASGSDPAVAAVSTYVTQEPSHQPCVRACARAVIVVIL